jgi:hypothetical protein
VLQNKLFDHKAITFTINRSSTQANYRNNISNTELDDDLLDYVVLASVCETSNSLFLKKFWKFFRVPLYKYTQHVFVTGNLTQSFNSAAIRLIPKKGDTKQLKNWRPISLLNCIYKIVSKALDARLQKINELILSRAQKGFTSNRNLQECLINILDTIAYAEK